MKKLFIVFFILLFPVYNSAKDNKLKLNHHSAKHATRHNSDAHIRKLYYDIGLENMIDYTAFKQAMIGHDKISTKKNNILTLIDFTKPSTDERLYVLDLKRKKIMYSTVVSHGKNSGGVYATSFSNKNGSHKSSLGFYVTENTYQGKNGYSLVLDGLEEGINDRAKQRAIVIHGANYADPSVIESNGRLGRSFGCPALPFELNQEIIDTIKGGSLLYIYADSNDYLENSTVLDNNSSPFNYSA